MGNLSEYPPHRMDEQSRRVLIRFGVGLAGLCVFTAVPSLTALGSLRDGVGMLSTLSALSGLCRITIAVMRKERLGVDHLNSWDEAAAYYAVSVLARMMTGVMS